MPIISVITPVFDGGDTYLPDAYQSLLTQSLPEGWSWEWIVQEDGQTGRPRRFLPRDDPRVRFASDTAGGAGVARTLALGRVHGGLVRALDADDLLCEGALARDITTLKEWPDAAWCISSCLDLLPDGSVVAGPYDPPPGFLSYAELRRAFEEDRFPVVATHLTARTELLQAVGGWPALPALEALALVLVCAAVSSGRMIAEPGGIYRKHSAQTTAQPSYRKGTDYNSLKSIILARLDSLQNMEWTWPSDSNRSHAR
jgi:hypothetical protein